MACPLPPAMAFAEAAVLPLGLGTAACGLFQEANLGLSLSPAPAGRVVLVWGASSSVGCNAVQLAVASGHEVVAVASQAHAQFLKQLGAAAVIDHRAPDVVAAVLAALDGKELAGALHATGDIAATLSVVARAAGRRKVAVTLAPPEHLPEGVKATAIHGTSLRDDGLGEAIYAGFLPEALAAGLYQAAPPPKVVGTGLEAFQPALEALKAGVSGTKLVVQLA